MPDSVLVLATVPASQLTVLWETGGIIMSRVRVLTRNVPDVVAADGKGITESLRGEVMQ